jgi:hypothetical protein
MEPESLAFDPHLAATWSEYFEKSKDPSDSAAKVYHESSEFREVESEIAITAFYNKRHDVSRFFDKSTKEEGEGGSDDSLDLDDDLNVFKKDTAGSDLIKVNEDKILFYVDLENEEVIAQRQEKEGERDMEEELDASTHPVLINQYPLGKNHAILLLFAEEGLPQILSDEILGLLFQIFRLSSSQDLRIGYNSMGGECWINNLHFHILNGTEVFPSTGKFPIESAEVKTFLSSSLKHNDEGEINMFSVGVSFGTTQNWPVQAFVVKPLPVESDPKSDLEALEGSEPTESVAHAVGVILNILIDSNTPHNILIADQGATVFVIPRKFDMLINAAHFSTEFNDLCGLVKCKDENTYNSLTWEQYSKFLRKEVALDADAFNKIQTSLVSKFKKEYHCTEE